MSDLVQVYNYTVAAGITDTAPTVDNAISSGIYEVVKVSIVIPRGHAGLTGIQLWYGQNAVIPYDSGWISGDGEVYPIELSSAYPPGVAWQVAMINSDVNSHNFQVRWEMNYLTTTATTTSATSVTTQAIYAAAG